MSTKFFQYLFFVLLLTDCKSRNTSSGTRGVNSNSNASTTEVRVTCPLGKFHVDGLISCQIDKSTSYKITDVSCKDQKDPRVLKFVSYFAVVKCSGTKLTTYSSSVNSSVASANGRECSLANYAPVRIQSMPESTLLNVITMVNSTAYCPAAESSNQNWTANISFENDEDVETCKTVNAKALCEKAYSSEPVTESNVQDHNQTCCQ